MAKIAVFFIILPMLAHTSSASIKNAYLGVINVTVEGAERTKDGTVKSLVERCLEKEQYTSWESIDTHILGKCISNSRLFEGVQVRVHEPDIDVAIEDRWTLIPIPIAYATDRKRSIGARVIDSNFLGYGKTVGIGGAVSTDGNAFSLSYLDPSVGFSNFTIKTSINQSSNEFDQYQRNTVIYAYRKKENTVLISLGYRITPTLELAVLANYADRRYEEIDPYTIVPDNYRSYSMGVRLSYSNADYNLYYNEGVSARIVWLQQINRSDENQTVSQATARFEWDTVLLDHNVLQLVVNAASLTDNGNAGDVLTFGRVKGYRGIEPNGLWARHMTAVSADYQIPVYKVTHGIFTIAPFFDYGMYKPVSPSTGSNYSAYGVGGYFFVDAISLPGAVGLLLGRNEAFMGTFVSFQLGYEF